MRSYWAAPRDHFGMAAVSPLHGPGMNIRVAHESMPWIHAGAARVRSGLGRRSLGVGLRAMAGCTISLAIAIQIGFR
jgi:hypothetical protein